MVVDTLAVSYDKKHSELVTKIQENEDMVVKMAQLEVSLNSLVLSQFIKIIVWVKIGHVNNIPTIQFFAKISRNTQSKSFMLSLTGCIWDFQNNALWDTHLHVLFLGYNV